MALIGLRGGGEHGNTAAWAVTVAALTRDAAVILPGMGGPASIKHSGANTGQSRFFFSTVDRSSFWFRFKIMVVSTAAPATAYTNRYTFCNLAAVLGAGFRITHNTDGTFSLCVINSGNTDVGTVYTGNPFVAGQTHSISGRFVAGATAVGTIEVKIDGVTVILQNNVLTATGGTNVPGTVAGFQFTATTVHNRVFHYGDFLFDDADYPPEGATVIARQFKAGTPTYDQFVTVGGGTKPANISQSPASSTLAIASTSTTAEEVQTALIASFSAVETGKGGGLIPAGSSILGVRAEAYVKSDNVTTTGSVGSTRLRLGGVNTDALVAALTTADTFRFGDVKTGVSLTDLNAGEAGWVKAATSAARVHTVEDMWVVAAYTQPVCLGSAVSAANASSYTFTVPLRAGRVLVAVEARAAGATCAINSITVGGTAATIPSGANASIVDGAGITRAAFAIADTAASTDDIVVELSVSAARASVGVWLIDGLDATPFDTASSLLPGNATDQTTTIDTAAGGALFAFMTNTGGGAWRHSGGSALTAAATGLTVTGDEIGGSVNWTGVSRDFDATVEAAVAAGDGLMVALALSPAAGTISGALAAVESGADALATSLAAIVGGQLVAVETGADSASIILGEQAGITGSLAAQEIGVDSAAIAGRTVVSGSLASAEVGPDLASLSGAVAVTGSLAVQEIGADTAAIAGIHAPASASLAAIESGSDTAEIIVRTLEGRTAALAAIESGPDLAAMGGQTRIGVTLAALEGGPDSAAIGGTVRVNGGLAAVESGADSAAIIAQVRNAASLVAIETGADVAAIMLRQRPITADVTLQASHVPLAALHGRHAGAEQLQGRTSAVRLRGGL